MILGKPLNSQNSGHLLLRLFLIAFLTRANEQLNWWHTMFPCTCIICTLCDTIYLGNACHSKVLNYLRRKFKSPAIAEVYYFPSNVDEVVCWP